VALAVLCLPLLVRAAPQAPAAAAAPRRVVHIRVASGIQPVAAEFIADALRQADAEGAAALVIELDTPGGLLTSTHDITTAMLGSRTPVVVYVSPNGARAASAGFFLLMAADVAAMAPSTNAGAAHPVGGQGETIEGTLGKKIEEDAAANIRLLAARNGRDPKLAQSAVLESRSFTAQEALSVHLIDVVAPDLPSLLSALDGRQVKKGEATQTLRTAGATIETHEMSGFRRFLAVLADPNIAYVLLVLGGLGLYFELMHPGAVLPGVVGGICLILAFFALSVLPVNYAGLALIFLSLVFFIAEIKVASYGLLTVGGVISLVIGSLMLFSSSEPALRVSLDLIGSLALFAVLVVGFLTFMVLRAHRAPVRTGVEGLVHEVGIARSSLAPYGKVFVHGELWDAEAAEPVAPGERVEVTSVRDLTLAVRPHRRGPVA
jgi:membrane-bound serine protease (ClpP class)